MTTLNAAQLLLDATSPRIVTVTLPDTIQIPAVKGVTITAPSTVFQVNTSGTASPTSILLTANLKQISGTVTWTVPSGTATLTGSGSTRTLTYANLGSSSATIRASVTDGGVTYTADFTIAKVTDGADGGTGSNGQRTAQLVFYKWGTSTPSAPSGTSTYTWATGGYTAPSTANGWTVGVGSGSVGQTLYSYTVGYTDALTAATTSVSMTGGTTVAFSRLGADGDPGADGANGTAHVTASSTTATKGAVGSTELTNAMVAATGRNPQTGDVVTLYNTSAKWSGDWRHNGSSWSSITLYVDGNAVITGTLTAGTISTNQAIIGTIGSYVNTGGETITSGLSSTITITTTATVSQPLWSWACSPPSGCAVSVVWTGNTGTSCTFKLQVIDLSTGLGWSGSVSVIKIWMF